MKKLILPASVLFIFLLEGMYVQFFGSFDAGQEWIFVPRFLFCTLFFIVLFYDRTQGFLYALCFGLLFDIVYTEVLGVYLALFPVLCYVLDRLMRLFHHHLLIIIAVTLLGIVGLEFSVYALNLLLQVTDMGMEQFLEKRLVPTLYFNGIFLILFSFPLRKFIFYLQAKILDE
ncbi:hypothetical protein GCM10008967_26000 [Bacillus carboniphilus]|uniref:Rod shape-determining protein MreD n=1 Tax=Bacillus carboniphilus TaxID=86663 RepID=A0ABN0WE48_9BACI